MTEGNQGDRRAQATDHRVWSHTGDGKEEVEDVCVVKSCSVCQEGRAQMQVDQEINLKHEQAEG